MVYLAGFPHDHTVVGDIWLLVRELTSFIKEDVKFQKNFRHESFGEMYMGTKSTSKLSCLKTQKENGLVSLENVCTL